jgi:hypothetical protein
MREWILSFDAGCSACRDIASIVQREAGTAIAVRNLLDPDVRWHRARALGTGAPWRPTLIELDGPQARAWTGPAMSARVTMRIGLRRALRVAHAIQREVVPDTEKSALLRLAPWVAAGAFLLTGGTAFAGTLMRDTPAGGVAAALISDSPGLSAENLIIGPNTENAAQVLAASQASARTGELLARLRDHGVTIEDQVVQKVNFAIDGQDPTSEAGSDMVRANLSANGMTSGGYCHVMEPEGDIVLSVMPRADGTIEVHHNDSGHLVQTILGHDGTVISSTAPTAAASDTMANPDVLNCFRLCDTIGGDSQGPGIPECLTSCLTVTIVSRWARLAHGERSWRPHVRPRSSLSALPLASPMFRGELVSWPGDLLTKS